jgi:hypothetical protein
LCVFDHYLFVCLFVCLLIVYLAQSKNRHRGATWWVFSAQSHKQGQDEENAAHANDE